MRLFWTPVLMGICVRMTRLEYESKKWYLRALHTENEASKVRFLAKYDHF